MTEPYFGLQHSRRENYLQVLRIMEVWFRDLEIQVPPPRPKINHGQLTYRYYEKHILQAILAKLARIVSGLDALDALLVGGLGQEASVMQRVLDDINEDIFFMVGIQKDELEGIAADSTSLKQEFLKAFWEEEFDNPSPLESSQKRPMPARSKVRANIARVHGLPDPSTNDRVGRTIHSVNSGYVHAAAPHIMDMLDESDPPKYMLSSMAGTIRMVGYIENAENYYLRGMYSFGVAAKAFGDAGLWGDILPLLQQFEEMIALRDSGHLGDK